MLIDKGGYIPNLLLEKHSQAIEKIQNKIIQQIDKVDYISVTTGPGLALSLSVGHKFALYLYNKYKQNNKKEKKIKIFYADHIEGHIMSYRMKNKQKFPFICLVVSGGHTILVNVKNLGNYQLLSKTIDDSVGEVFDKLARHMGINPQNGQGVENEALSGKIIDNLLIKNIKIKENNDYMSFSGIKTKFINIINSRSNNINDICKTFQHCISTYLGKIILKLIKNNKLEKQSLIICGGVANNKYLLRIIKLLLSETKTKVKIVDSELATDNAEMIAWLCYEYVKNNKNRKYSSLCRSSKTYNLLKYENFI